MNAKIIDFARSRDLAPDDLAGLNAHLAQLIGEPFQFVRVSYGDELTIHFGNLRPARSPKLKDKLYGEYVLGLRASRWSLKGGKIPGLVSSGIISDETVLQSAPPLEKEDLETSSFIEPLSIVVATRAFYAAPYEGLGLVMSFSDGTALFALPTSNDPADQCDPSLPAIADWELLSSKGLLSAGPGSAWSFKAAAPAP